MTPEQRVHAMDAVRAFALLGGIIVHAAMSFSPAFATLGWPIVDVSPSRALQAIFHVLHSFRMVLFFLVAGFFARMIIEHKGLSGFWRDRLKRIAAPLAAGWIVLMPLVVAAIVWAVVKKHGGLPGNGRAAAAAGTGIPLGHLWFLYYLLIFYVIVVVFRWIGTPLDRSAGASKWLDIAVRWMVQKHATALLLPLPLAACLYFDADWIAWTGIPTPQNGLTPHPTALVGFGTAFVIGWLLQRQQVLLQTWARCWHVHLILAIAASLCSLWLVGLNGSTTALATDSERFLYALSYTLGAWNWVLAILGFAVRYLCVRQPAIRYLADSAYWIYLVHLPLVLALQVTVMQWHAHWSIKFTLILTVATALLLGSYHVLVRNTFIGAWLNGRRYPRRALERAAAPVGSS